MAVIPVPAMDDQVSDVDPPTVTLLGSVLGRVGVDPDNGGGPLNVGMFARAALFGSVPRPNWEEVGGGCLGYQGRLKYNATHASRFLFSTVWVVGPENHPEGLTPLPLRGPVAYVLRF